jgi:hypothetical protein
MPEDQTDQTEQNPENVPAEESRSQSEQDHTLAQPSELAGTADGAIAAEFAMRDAQDALADATGAAAGADLESETLPHEGD